MRSQRCRCVVLSLLVLAAAAPPGFAAGYTLPEPAAAGFSPFGWSARGSFGYMMAEFVDGRGGTLYTFAVHDAVQDVVTWTFTDDSFDWPEGSDDTVEAAWSRNEVTVTAAFSRAGIVQAGPLSILPFPVVRQGEKIAVDLALTARPGADEYEPDYLSGYRVVLVSSTRGSKVVTNQANLQVMGAEVRGYVPSPLEPRILVVVAETTAGFEGSTVGLVFYGSHLGVGFTK